MTLRVLVLGAGFGGLELSSMLSDALGADLDLTLIDRNDSFFFGFSKLDVMFGRNAPESVRIPYRSIVKPGVRFCQETITAIDPVARRVTTEHGTYDADVLVVALGADYDPAATPGLVEGGYEFYSFAGAERLRGVLPTFSKGRAIVGVTSTPFKCPPAPSEAALLLHDQLTTRGVREACEISLVMPFGIPIPPSPGTSKALLSAFAERGITFVPNRLVRALDPGRHVATLDDGSEMPYDLFLGIPRHRVPDVVAASGMTENGWIPVDPKNLQTALPRCVCDRRRDQRGHGQGRRVRGRGCARGRGSADRRTDGRRAPAAYKGEGTCYVEFGGKRVGRVDVDFLLGPIAHRELHRSLGRPGRREEGIRRKPALPLVRIVRQGQPGFREIDIRH